jgi:hypothetical protein
MHPSPKGGVEGTHGHRPTASRTSTAVRRAGPDRA